MSKNLIKCLLVVFMLYVEIPQINAQTKSAIAVDFSTKKFVGGVSTLDRSKYFNLHHEPNFEFDVNELDGFVNNLKMDFGRNVGGITFILSNEGFIEDPNKPGFPDIDFLKEKGQIKVNNSLNNPRAPFFTKEVVYTAQKSIYGRPGNTAAAFGPETPESSASYIGNFIRYYFSDATRPKYLEPFNEPFIHTAELNTTNLAISQWHNLVADSVKKLSPDVKVGGFTSAFPSWEINNFGLWENNMKLFIDVAGDKMDFLSVHLYDVLTANNSDGPVSQRSGSNTEAILDIQDAYTNIKFGEVKPIMISEYGSGGPDWLGQPNTSDRDWSIIRSVNAHLQSFLERPDRVVKTIPFITGRSFFFYNATDTNPDGNPYPWVISKRLPDGSFELTDLIKFYDFWKDVKGERVLTYTSNPDVAINAFVSTNEAYVVLSNLDFINDQSVDISILNGNLSNIVSTSVKSIYFDGSGTVQLTEGPATATPPGTIDLRKGESVILTYTLNTNIVFGNTNQERNFYATEYLKPISANTPITYQIPNVVIESADGIAYLRVGFGRGKDKQLKPAVLFNDILVKVPDNVKGDQSNRNDFFGVIKIPINPTWIQTNNTVSITFNDDGGSVSSVILNTQSLTNAVAGLPVITPQGVPFNNVAAIAPGRVEVEAFNLGGQGIGYNDVDETNNGGAFRAEGVDLISLAGGEVVTSDMVAGEWLEYTFNVTADGDYKITSAMSGNGSINFVIDDFNLEQINSTTLPSEYEFISTNNLINLKAGLHTLRVNVISGSPSIDFFQFVIQTSPDNIVVNPGFETGDFTGWKLNQTQVIVEEVDSIFNGLFSAKVTGVGAISQDIAILPNSTYRMRLVGKAVAAGQRAGFGILRNGDAENSTQITSTEFKEHVVVFRTGATNTEAEFYIFAGKAGDQVIVDDFEVILSPDDAKFIDRPDTIPSTKNLTFNVEYKASELRDIALVLLSPTGGFIKEVRRTVPEGEGQIEFTLNLNDALAIDQGYQLFTDVRLVGSDFRGVLVNDKILFDVIFNEQISIVSANELESAANYNFDVNYITEQDREIALSLLDPNGVLLATNRVTAVAGTSTINIPLALAEMPAPGVGYELVGEIFPVGGTVATKAITRLVDIIDGVPNLVVNAGFETGDLSGWPSTFNPDNISVTSDPANVFAGNFSASVMGPSSLIQLFDLKPNTKYNLSAYGKVEAAGQKVFLGVLGFNGTQEKGATINKINFTFTELSFITGDLPTTTTIYVFAPAGNTGFVDNFTLKEVIQVNGVAFPEESLAIEVTDNTPFAAIVTPEDAVDKTVNYNTSNPAVATVSEDGILSGISEGVATITATSVDGGFTDSLALIVETYKGNNLANYRFESGNLDGWNFFRPENIVIETEDVFEGSFSGHSLGLASISQLVKVVPNTTYLYSAFAKVTEAGMQAFLGVLGYGGPELGRGINKLEYTQVSLSFTTGQTDTTASVYLFNPANIESFYDQFSLTVPVQSISILEGNVVTVPDSVIQLNAVIVPDIATNQNVTWAIADSTIATIDQNGLLTANAGGETIVTITSEDGGLIAEATVQVQAPFTGVANVIPGILEAEEYDLGGNGAAYFDLTAGNQLNGFRTDDVDISVTDDLSGNFHVGNAVSSEWLEYTVDVTVSSGYFIHLRAASVNGGNLSLTLDGNVLEESVTIPAVTDGSWGNFTTKKPYPLEAGQHVLRLTFGSDDIKFNSLEIEEESALCAGTADWDATSVYPGSGIVVKYDGRLYESKYYASAGLSPDDINGPWKFIGYCGDTKEDCFNTPEYLVQNIYPTTGTQVTHNGDLYTSKSYIDAGQKPGETNKWELAGQCSATSINVVSGVELCSTAPDFDAAFTYPTAGTIVNYNGALWSSAYYVSPGIIPGTSPAWEFVSMCIEDASITARKISGSVDSSIVAAKKSFFNVYPNPVSGNLLTVTFEKGHVYNTLSIIDVSGKEILTKAIAGSSRVDIERSMIRKHVKNGVFLVKVIGDKNVSIRRIILK